MSNYQNQLTAEVQSILNKVQELIKQLINEPNAKFLSPHVIDLAAVGKIGMVCQSSFIALL